MYCVMPWKRKRNEMRNNKTTMTVFLCNHIFYCLEVNKGRKLQLNNLI